MASRFSIAVNGACPDLANGHSQAVCADRAHGWAEIALEKVIRSRGAEMHR